MRIKTVIVDDNPEGLSLLKSLCDKDAELQVEACFTSGDQFMEKSASLNYQLCLLDVEMPGLDGMECARRLPGKQIIFVSAHFKEHAHAAFDLDAVDFVKKPVDVARFEKAILKAKENLKNKPGVTFEYFSTDKGDYRLFFDQLVLVKTDKTITQHGRDKVALLNNGSTLIIKRSNMEEILAKLPNDQFAQVGKGMVINLDCFSSILNKAQDEIEIRIPDTDSPGKSKRHQTTLGEPYKAEFLLKVGYVN